VEIDDLSVDLMPYTNTSALVVSDLVRLHTPGDEHLFVTVGLLFPHARFLAAAGNVYTLPMIIEAVSELYRDLSHGHAEAYVCQHRVVNVQYGTVMRSHISWALTT
jgi:hypothetical protein